MITSLKSFWIVSPYSHAPLGFGVTAKSLDDAIAIIHALGYGNFLPDNLYETTITEGVKVSELDLQNVVPRMGSIAIRGMWYPAIQVGVPKWAEERLILRKASLTTVPRSDDDG